MLNDFTDIESEGKYALVGCILCFAGLGSLAIWVNVNIYYFSYFYIYDHTLSFQVFNTLISLTALIAAIAALVSLNLADRIGYSTVLRTGMICYALAVIASGF